MSLFFQFLHQMGAPSSALPTKQLREGKPSLPIARKDPSFPRLKAAFTPDQGIPTQLPPHPLHLHWEV